MNIVGCPECGLDWPEGLVHENCPGPLAPPIPKVKASTCETDPTCKWNGVVVIVPPKDSSELSWRSCREHAVPYRNAKELGFDVIDRSHPNRLGK